MFRLVLSIIVVTLFLQSCTGTLQRLQRLGQSPTLQEVELPNTRPGYKPIVLPKSDKGCDPGTPNSLWRSGSRAFFKDRKARNIGDIIKIQININDSATLDNKTTRERKGTDNLAMPKLFGMQTKIFNSEQKNFSLLDLKGGSKHEGQGKIDRNETISTEVAAIVAQILPNGNMVVMGSQEVRVNFEVRHIAVKGIVRPEDVSIDNTVSSGKIAELRVDYGGRGDMSDMQQPRLGSQLLDIISPF